MLSVCLVCVIPSRPQLACGGATAAGTRPAPPLAAQCSGAVVVWSLLVLIVAPVSLRLHPDSTST